MIENIIFDIGNVILNFDIQKVVSSFTSDALEQKFILDYIIYSPEWLGYALIDSGFVKREDAIKLVEDRTNHVHDDLIERFWNCYNDFASIDDRMLKLIQILKKNHYKVYLLSNINPYTYAFVCKSGLFEMVDGYVLSYLEHQVKPYQGIYQTLLKKYELDAGKSLFIDDNFENVKTANRLGILGHKVLPDDYDSVLQLLKEYQIYFE